MSSPSQFPGLGIKQGELTGVPTRGEFDWGELAEGGSLGGILLGSFQRQNIKLFKVNCTVVNKRQRHLFAQSLQ